MATERTPGTLPELMRQLAALQSQVEKVKEKEKADVVGRMREAIEVYGIKQEELFPKRGYAARKAANEEKPVKAKKVKKPKRVRRYLTDEQKIALLKQHTAQVEGGSTFDAASTKAGYFHSVIRKWYKDLNVPLPKRAA